MKLRFIEFQEEVFVVVGQTYNMNFHPPECFVAVHVSLCRGKSITRELITNSSVVIPVAYSKEITDKVRLMTLMLLYDN